MAVWGMVEGVAHNFISVYVHPQMQATTLRDLGKVVLGLPPGVTVIGGDCNAMLNRERDFSRGTRNTLQMLDSGLGRIPRSVWYLANLEPQHYTIHAHFCGPRNPLQDRLLTNASY